MLPPEELWLKGVGGVGGCTETKDHPVASHPPEEPGSLSLESLSPPHRDSGDVKGKAAAAKPRLCSRLRDQSNLVVWSALLALGSEVALPLLGRQVAPKYRAGH